MRIGFIGLGKLGLPVAEAMAEKHIVLGYDVNPNIPVKNVIAMDRLEAVAMGSDIVFIAVPTPHQKEFGGSMPMPSTSADFSYGALKETLAKLGRMEDELGKTQVVIISTVLPNTLRTFVKRYFQENQREQVIYNPYFIAMGTVVNDFKNPEVILVGSIDGHVKRKALLETLYDDVCDVHVKYRIRSLTWEEAECAKVFYNTFISLKISFVNMIQEVCQRIGNANVDKVTEAITSDRKRIISPMYTKAGGGDGGPCHPRDNIALRALSERLGLGYDLFGSIMQAREQQAWNLADFVWKEIRNHTQGSPLLVIVGKAFKPGVNLTDGSYSLLVGHFLEKLYPHVCYHDPLTGDEEPDGDEPRAYLLMHPDANTGMFNKGSIVIDIWRDLTLKEYRGDIAYIPYGDSRK